MGRSGHNIDWARVSVHFGIGAIVGAGLAFLTCAFSYEGAVWKPMVVAGLTIGILGAAFGDRFWEGFASVMKWVGWWI